MAHSTGRIIPFLCVVLAFSVAAHCKNTALPGDIVQREVFKAGEGGYYCFRIPALLFTTKDTLLAFAEGRGQHTKVCSDHGDVHIILKRSTDFGATWSNLTVVYAEYPDHTIGTYVHVDLRIVVMELSLLCPTLQGW